MLTDLYKANVLSYCIIQVSSHKCLDFIEDYHKIASIKHQDQIFRILSENTGSTGKDPIYFGHKHQYGEHYYATTTTITKSTLRLSHNCSSLATNSTIWHWCHNKSRKFHHKLTNAKQVNQAITTI